MSIYNVINSLKEITPLTLENAQKFLDEITALEREQLIAAIYLGREHIHCTELKNNDSDLELSRSYTDHIGRDEYARILHEKGKSINTYLDKLVSCAVVSKFNLDNL